MLVAMAMTAMLLVAAGKPASAHTAIPSGSNGQQVSLRDVAGYYYSAHVYGFNQYCKWVMYNIPNWQNHDYNMNGWWWRSSDSCGDPGNAFQLVGFARANYGGGHSYDFFIGQPPVSQSGDWTTCAADNPGPGGPEHGCVPGYQAFG